MRVMVKICGLRRPEDVAAVADLAPDAMGFVFWDKSRRYAPPETMAAAVAGIPAGILRVGVFVDAPRAHIRDVIRQLGLNVVQLHGSESPEDCRGFSVPVWKAIPADRCAPAEAARYPVDALVLDSYSAESPGGTGCVGDWDLVARWTRASPRPVVLAGGLAPGNVSAALQTVAPWGVDVCSGVEAAPGVKDLNKVKEFIRQCRA